MAISVEFNGSVSSIFLSGKIDYGMQEDFKKAIKQVLSEEGTREIQVNFAEATFLDSAGIRALLILQKEANASGKSMLILDCNEYIRETLEIGGFDKMFTFR